MSDAAPPVSLAIRRRPVALPRPAELPASPPYVRVEVLIDADAVSHGLAEGTGADRAPNNAVAACLATVQRTARALVRDPASGRGGYRVRCAGSTETVRHHLDLVLAAPNNTWSFCRGIDVADLALLDSLESLAISASRRPDRRDCDASRAHPVVLVAQDHIYAGTVRQLRLLGVPTWVLKPGRYIATDLYKAACAVTPLIPALAD